MWIAAKVAAIATAGLLTATAYAEQVGTATMVELDVAGRVVKVFPGDGVPLVETDAAHYQLRIVSGDVQVENPGIVVVVSGDRPANILPQSQMASGDGIVESAWLSVPTGRYRHGVLGDRLEAAALSVRLRDGIVATLDAGADAVFEDLRPRLADLDDDGLDEIIVVKSYLDRGAALAVVGLDADGELATLAETPPIGRPHRWLNPVGAADFDGDGAVEIAYVQTPHIGGTLMIWEWRDGGLVREHAEPGFSNHAMGSTELGLSAIVDIDGDGRMDLAVPGSRRDRLRLISVAGGVLREIADVELGGVVSTAIAPLGNALVFGLDDGRLIALRFGP